MIDFYIFMRIRKDCGPIPAFIWIRKILAYSSEYFDIAYCSTIVLVCNLHVWVALSSLRDFFSFEVCFSFSFFLLGRRSSQRPTFNPDDTSFLGPPTFFFLLPPFSFDCPLSSSRFISYSPFSSLCLSRPYSLVLAIISYTSSSLRSILGTPFFIGNFLPVSGHTKFPSSTTTWHKGEHKWRVNISTRKARRKETSRQQQQ